MSKVISLIFLVFLISMKMCSADVYISAAYATSWADYPVLRAPLIEKDEGEFSNFGWYYSSNISKNYCEKLKDDKSIELCRTKYSDIWEVKGKRKKVSEYYCGDYCAKYCKEWAIEACNKGINSRNHFKKGQERRCGMQFYRYVDACKTDKITWVDVRYKNADSDFVSTLLPFPKYD